jgi:hypothetical protein
MKQLLKPMVIASAVLASLGSAQATVITFDDVIDAPAAPFFPLMGHFEEFTTQGFWVDTFNTKAGAQPGDLVGAVVDGADLANTCVGLICPVGNTTHFLAALNDGLPDIGRQDGGSFRVNQFDASFIAAPGDTVRPSALLLRVEGYSTTALLYQQDFFLPGPVNGAYSFGTYALSTANAGMAVNDVAFRGFACTTATSCTRSLDKAQFAIDNLTVPEPAGWSLVGLQLIALGALARRRSAKANQAAAQAAAA